MYQSPNEIIITDKQKNDCFILYLFLSFCFSIQWIDTFHILLSSARIIQELKQC